MRPESLMALHQQLERFYAATTTKRQRSDRMYHHDVSSLMQVPEGMKMHESSTASLLVDSLRDQIRIDEPIISYDATGRSQAALQFKEVAQTWGAAALHEISKAALIDPIEQAVHDCLLRGAGCIKHLVNPEYQLPEGKQAQGLFPFLVRSLDPISVYPCPGSSRPPKYILEVQHRTVLDMQMQYGHVWHDPLVGRSKKRGSDASVLWLEFWSEPVYRAGKKVEPGYYIVEADGVRIIDIENPYGIVPYVFSYSGLGRSNFDGEPSHLSEGILDGIVGELEEEIRIKTAWAHQWLFSAYPRLLTTDDPRKVRRQFMVAAGSVIKYEPGAEPHWLEQPAPNEAMLRFLEVVTANINKKLSPALTERPTGVDAGVHQALLLGQALKVIAPVRRAIDLMGGDLLNGLAKQMQALDIKMNVHGGTESQQRMVKGSDFKHFTFKVAFESVDPIENDRRMLAGLALRRERADGLPLISRRTFMERYMGGIIENIDDEEALLLAESAIAQLVASGALLGSVMQEVQGVEGAGKTASAAGQLERMAGARERTLEGLTGGQMTDTELTGRGGRQSAEGGL